jgi:hypothetical protein
LHLLAANQVPSYVGEHHLKEYPFISQASTSLHFGYFDQSSLSFMVLLGNDCQSPVDHLTNTSTIVLLDPLKTLKTTDSSRQNKR